MDFLPPADATVPNDVGGHRTSKVMSPMVPNLLDKSTDSGGCMEREESCTVFPAFDAEGNQTAYMYKVPQSMQRETNGSEWRDITEQTSDMDLQEYHIDENLECRVRCPSTWLTIGVDENSMVEEHPGYHQEITGEEAERRLRRCGGHCHLTRYSMSQKCYVLSVHEHRKPLQPVIKHFKITINDDGRANIHGKRHSFSGVKSLLEHYEHNRVDPAVTSIGRAYTEEEYRRRRRSGCEIL